VDAITGGDVRAAEHEEPTSEGEQDSAWTDVIEVMVLFVRAEGGYVLTGSNDRGERIFERTAWSVGLPAVKAEVTTLAAGKGYVPEGDWAPDEKPHNVLNYTRGPLRRTFRADG